MWQQKQRRQSDSWPPLSGRADTVDAGLASAAVQYDVATAVLAAIAAVPGAADHAGRAAHHLAVAEPETNTPVSKLKTKCKLCMGWITLLIYVLYPNKLITKMSRYTKAVFGCLLHDSDTFCSLSNFAPIHHTCAATYGPI